VEPSTKVSTEPSWKFTTKMLLVPKVEVLLALVVADQKLADVTVENGWPGVRVGPGKATEGSIRLASSGMDGSRQPFVPPTVFLRHPSRARSHMSIVAAIATRVIDKHHARH
jgi:hypothetical protein